METCRKLGGWYILDEEYLFRKWSPMKIGCTLTFSYLKGREIVFNNPLDQGKTIQNYSEKEIMKVKVQQGILNSNYNKII